MKRKLEKAKNRYDITGVYSSPIIFGAPSSKGETK